MKKQLVFAVAALALAACTQEKNIVPADPGLTEITATHVSTRSALYVSDGETLYNILWDAPDKIMVGYAGSELATFTSKNESPAAEATFTGKLPEGSGELYGIYPAEDGNTVEDDGTYKIIMHTVQTAVEGSYDPMAFPAIAQSESKNLSFMNVFGLLELTVGYDDVTSLFFGVKMSESEVNPRPLTRKTADPLVINVQMKDGAPQITSIDGENETGGFVLNPPKGSECFKIDTPYYLAVHPVGGWLQGMYPTFWLSHSDGTTTEIVFESQPLIERSKVHNVKRLFLEDEPEVPEAEAIFLDGNKTISVGESITLVPTINPSNATPVLVWSSDDPETVSVTQEGVITGEKSGGTLVTVTVEGSDPDLQPDLTVSIYVTVTADDPTTEDPYNGHEYVDLGLPSKLKWATCNIGAENPEDPGDYFAWAETEPYYDSIAADGTATWKKGKEEGYRWRSYSWMDHTINGSKGLTKYTFDDGRSTVGPMYNYPIYNTEVEAGFVGTFSEFIDYLRNEDSDEAKAAIMDRNAYVGSWDDFITLAQTLSFVGDGITYLGDPEYDYEDDAARQIWGGNWCIPSPEDFQELIDNTDNGWTDDYGGTGKAGYIFTSKEDATKSIFLPASGLMYSIGIRDFGDYGTYWSSSLGEDYAETAFALLIGSDIVTVGFDNRYFGHSLRPVAP